jgi:plastocyanin
MNISILRARAWLILFGFLSLVLLVPALAQDLTVTAQVDIRGQRSPHRHRDRANVVVWLIPFDDNGTPHPVSQETSARPPRLVQKDKKFEPHLLVVPAGTAVEFPNRDPFFHNVFSLFEGKRFDLGLYEAGSTRAVHFDRVGVSYIFCNIHPEMSAVVVALKTPYYGVSDAAGKIVIPNVPSGRYSMQVWAEGASVDHLKTLRRELVLSRNEYSIGTIHITEDGLAQVHKNKYGRDYDAPGADYPPADQK